MRKILNPGTMEKIWGDKALREDDVVVATFAKSGTNWTLQICQQASHYGEAEFEHIHDLVPWPEAPVPGIVKLHDTKPIDTSPTGIRVIKTHLPAELLPYNEKTKFITVIRDPKEVCVSAYHFMLGVMGIKDKVTPAEWFELFLEKNGLGTEWVKHTAGLWAWRERPNVYTVTYSEMKKNSEVCIRKMVELLGVELTHAQFEKVLKRSHVSHMKANESQFAPPKFPLVKPGTKMIRRGEAGSSGELLTEEQQKKIDAFAIEQLKALGSDFPYEELFLTH